MKVYVLVSKDKDDEPTFNMPVTFGRGLRAYDSKPRAKVYARRFKCMVVELEVERGEVIYDAKDPTSQPAL